MNQKGEQFDPYYQWLGIPPEEQPPNHYRLLGIQPLEANPDVIQNAADRQMVHLRTFQSGPRGAHSQKLLNEIAAAKLCLLSDEKKAAYDEQLRESIAAAEAAAGPPVDAPPVEDPALNSLFKSAGPRPTSAKPQRARHSQRKKGPVGLVVALVVVVGLGAVIAIVATALLRGDPVDRLVLTWPESERAGARLEIDGRPVDLTRDATVVTTDRLEYALEPGTHTYRITRPRSKPLEGAFTLEAGTRVELTARFTAPEKVVKSEKRSKIMPKTAEGRLILQWPGTRRRDAVVEIDGKPVDLSGDQVSQSRNQIQIVLEAGKHSVRVRHRSSTIVDQEINLDAGEQRVLSVNRPQPLTMVRVRLLWPESERAGADLEIDGKHRSLTARSGGDAEHIAFKLSPGKHTVRISRPGFEPFEGAVNGQRDEVSLAVTWKPLVRVPLSSPEMEEIRRDFQLIYREFKQYKDWIAATEPGQKRDKFRFLIARLGKEAEEITDDLPAQLVAFDESIQLALESHEFVVADGILNAMKNSRIYRTDELESLSERLWKEALNSSELQSIADYLKLRETQQKVPTAPEQSMIVDTMIASPQASEDYTVVESILNDLSAQGVLGAQIAQDAQRRLCIAAVESVSRSPAEAITLGEKLLDLIPPLFAAGSQSAVDDADRLVDAVNSCRRIAAADRLTGEQDTRVKQMADQVKEWERAVKANKAILAGTGSSGEYKFLGFWLMQRGQFSESLPHLRGTGDESLADLAVAPPKLAREISELADSVEQESKSSKYTSRQKQTLRSYTRHLREQALATNDDSLGDEERKRVQTLIDMTESQGSTGSSAEARRFPKRKWCRLVDVTTLEELRDRAKRATGTWTVMDDGTIIATQRGRSKLELPVDLGDSYGIRFFCTRGDGYSVNVNLPLGERAVLFTLGAFAGRYSGLQMIDGKYVSQQENPTSIDSRAFTLRKGVPVHVEILVKTVKAADQSVKERKDTGGRDWTWIQVLLNGQPVINFSAATSRFDMDGNFRLTQNVVGFSAEAQAQYRDIRVRRN